MTLRLEFAPRALADAERAAEWYEDRFRQEFDRVIAFIQENPEVFPSVNARFRRALLRPFPFEVIYTATSTLIQVIGVIPTHCEPVGVVPMGDRSPE